MTVDTVSTSLITVDYGNSLQAMIAAGKYDWVNSDITAKRFPVEGAGTKTFRTKLFHFDRWMSSEDAVAAMKKEKFTPGTHVHGLAFGAAFPEEQRKYQIACLGSFARVRGSRDCRERFAEIAGDFVRLKVNVIVTGGSAVSALKQATSVIPIVFILATDPIGGGVIASLSRPGENVTGSSSLGVDLAAKRLSRASTETIWSL